MNFQILELVKAVNAWVRNAFGNVLDKNGCAIV